MEMNTPCATVSTLVSTAQRNTFYHLSNQVATHWQPDIDFCCGCKNSSFGMTVAVSSAALYVMIYILRLSPSVKTLHTDLCRLSCIIYAETKFLLWELSSMPTDALLSAVLRRMEGWMLLSHEAVWVVMKNMKGCFFFPPSHKAVSFRGLEEEDGGMGGLMFLSEEAALQTDSSVSTAFRLKHRF